MLDGHKEGIDFYIIPKTEKLGDSVVSIKNNFLGEQVYQMSHVRKDPVSGGLRPGQTQTGLLSSLKISDFASTCIGIMLFRQQTTGALIRLRKYTG